MKTICTWLGLMISVIVVGQTDHSMEASHLVPRYSSVPDRIVDIHTPSLSLNGTWSFYVKERPFKREDIQVPGEWEMQGFKVDEGETAVYSRRLNLPLDWENRPVKIRFDGVSSHAIVKINNKEVAAHEGGFTPFEVDIAPYLTFTNDSIQVEVKANTTSDKLGCISQYAVHTVGGILRKVVVFANPKQYVKDFNYNVIGKYAKERARIQFTGIIHNTGTATKLLVEHTLFWKNTKVKTFRNTIAVGDGKEYKYKSELQLNDPKWWNPENPALYELETIVYENGKETVRYKNRLGVRILELDGTRLLLNGVALKLKGVNRHTVHPLLGRASNPELDIQDAKLFKEANCNYIRTSHYPPSEEFLNAADSIGLVVESEAALCWIQHGASPIWRWWNYKDEKWLPFLLRANAENVKAGRNHPSVLLWSLGNESHWSPLWDEVNSMVKKIDPSRPTVFHDQCWGGFNNGGSKADIANYHYPNIGGPAATDTMKRPTLFGEFAHLSTYNRLELLADPGLRAAYGPALRQFVDTMYQHAANLGGAIWSGIDDEFHLPDGRMVGYGPWGPIDGWRRPKPEYWGVKKAYTPLRVYEPDWKEAVKGNLTLWLENRYLYTALADLKFELRVDGLLQPVKLNIEPGKTGVIKLPVNNNLRTIEIKLYDPSGFLAEWELFEKPHDFTYDSTHTTLSYQETENSIQVKQGDTYYSISKMKGVLTGAWIADKLILKEGPVFCVIPKNSSFGDKPNVAGETYQNDLYPVKAYSQYPLMADSLLVTRENGELRIRFYVRYLEAVGYQTYRFTESGFCQVDYSIKYTGKDSIPYQYGLLMKASTEMDKLTWKRKGQFSTYPTDDIARLEGYSRMDAEKIGAVAVHGLTPASSWKEDRYDWGKNDFRATKYNILKAGLSNANGNMIEVFSNTKQSSRTWLQDASIHWLVADYWNNGSEPFYSSPFVSPRNSIKNITLSGSVKFRIK